VGKPGRPLPAGAGLTLRGAPQLRDLAYKLKVVFLTLWPWVLLPLALLVLAVLAWVR
jgi:ABC-type uncharacterized transport system involved in gliding motility auxiliary subunit